jgi:hypothetical protein
MREVHIILERKLIQLFCFVQAHDLWKIPTSSKRTSPCFSGWSKPTNLIEELNYFFPDVSSSFIVQRIIHVFFPVQTKIDLALLLEGHYVFLVSHCLISQLSPCKILSLSHYCELLLIKLTIQFKFEAIDNKRCFLCWQKLFTVIKA